MPDATVIETPRLGGYGAGLRAVTPLLPAVLAFGVSFGVLSQAGAFRGGWLRRLLEAQLLVDESWALSQRDGGFDRRVLIGAGLGLYAGWSGGTAIGVVAGDSLADPATLGLDAAFPALFLALLAPLVLSRKRMAAALLGAGIALALTPVTPAGIPVIAATAACLVGLRR
jgi:predicted branched-subunit amino acid permease